MDRSIAALLLEADMEVDTRRLKGFTALYDHMCESLSAGKGHQ